MKASELRIGNISKNGVVNSIHENSLQIKCRFGNLYYDFIPILLTEEWILKFGFEKFSGVGLFRIVNRDLTMSLMIAFTGNHYTLSIPAPSSPIKYVHQLQNLYFALVGEELVLQD